MGRIYFIKNLFCTKTCVFNRKIETYAEINNVVEAVNVMQLIYNEFKSMPLLDSILSPYSRFIRDKFCLVTQESYIQGDNL